MKSILLGVALCLAAPSLASAQWWKEPPAGRLDQKLIDPSNDTAARLKWDDGYIEVKAGATADKAIALNAAHEVSLAEDAARAQAYAKLAEVVEGVSIDGVTVVKNAMVADQTVVQRVQGRIRGAVQVGQPSVRKLADGSVWVEVVLGIRLRGAGSVTEAVAPWAASRSVDPYRPDPDFRVSDVYTGLIIEASDTAFSPALAPQVVEEGSGKVVFAPRAVQIAALNQQGPVEYASTLGEARRSPRVGQNPLIVRSITASSGRKGDLVLSRRDAERVLAADRAGGFLAKGAVVVALGKQPGELRGQPGRRHAVLVGVDEYPNGGVAPLTYAVRDAQAVAKLLAGFGADVTVLDNRKATRRDIVEALSALRSRVRDEDTVVLFFSGHGATDVGPDGRPHYYLVPHDGSMTDLAHTALIDDQLEELIGQLPARQVVVLLDACFSGGGTGIIRARGVTRPASTSPPPGRALIEATSGRVVLSASRPDEPAFEDDQRKGGLFTSFLVEGLSGAADVDGDGVVTVLELYQFVSPRVRAYAQREYQVSQTPVLEVRGLSGEIVLARRR